jgi:hypothetical protein
MTAAPALEAAASVPYVVEEEASFHANLTDPKMARTVLLSVPTGHHVEDLLRGAFLRSLLTACPRPRVVVVSPFALDEGLTAEVARSGIDLEPLPKDRPRIAARVVDSILSEKFLHTTRLRAVRLQRDRARLLDEWRGRRALIALKAACCRLPVSRAAWFRVAEAVTDVSAYRVLFDRYRPDLIVTATAGFLPIEVPLIYAAKRFGVPQMGIDLGWDNLSSKYHTVLPVDYLAVWNETMRDEAIRYHGFSPDRVQVTGAVPFDVYTETDEIPTRAQLFSSIGADPARPLVTLATAPALVYPTTERVTQLLATAAHDGDLGADAQLLVRVHPRDTFESYERFHDGRRVFVEKPFQRLERSPGLPELDAFTPGANGRLRLAATLAHSAVIVNFASTTTIEAALFDTPVVNIGFDEAPDLPLPLSIGRYYHYEHYQPVVETGGARVATSGDDLVATVREYVLHPWVDADARRELVRRCCTFTGGAGERAARWVLKALAETATPGGAS